ncbi:MAG: aldo/keto reductase [Geminicoccaceae bacterium]
MQYRKLGRTGLDISEFTFGGGWVGGILIHQDEDIRARAIERALAAGCNWIDTAALYGQGQSETHLGEIFREGSGRKAHLSTKFRLDTQSREDRASQIRRALEESLRRLRMDRVALYQLHNPLGDGSDNTVTAREALEIAEILEELRAEGLFDFIGFTALGDTAGILEVIDARRYETAQVYYNMLNQSAGTDAAPAWGGQDFSGILAACEATQTGVMNIRVLAAGVLATDERHGREVIAASDSALDAEEKRASALFGRIGTLSGSRAQSAIRFSLAEPRLSTVVVGLASLDHLDEALAAFEKGPLDAIDREAVLACQETSLS